MQKCPVELRHSCPNTPIYALTHLISLKGNEISGQMLINLNVHTSEEGMYKSNLEFIKGRIKTYKAFDITEEKAKKTF